METWQVIGLIWAAGALALVLPGLGARLSRGQPVMRWGLIWLVAILTLVLAYEVLVALGLDAAPARRWRTAY